MSDVVIWTALLPMLVGFWFYMFDVYHVTNAKSRAEALGYAFAKNISQTLVATGGDTSTVVAKGLELARGYLKPNIQFGGDCAAIGAPAYNPDGTITVTLIYKLENLVIMEPKEFTTSSIASEYDATQGGFPTLTYQCTITEND